MGNNRRFWALLLAAAALLLLLAWRFPYAMTRPEQKMQLLYTVLLVALVATGPGLLRRLNAPQAARYALIWLGIILLLALGYSLRGEIAGHRLVSALIPSRLQATEDGAFRVSAAENGHFYLEAEINGALLHFMVDTGASDIVLSPRDAEVAGYDTGTLNYTRSYRTANGAGSGAPVRIKTLAVGPLMFRDVPASVNRADMHTSLLGLAFLRQFREYRFSGDTLTLYP